MDLCISFSLISSKILLHFVSTSWRLHPSSTHGLVFVLSCAFSRQPLLLYYINPGLGYQQGHTTYGEANVLLLKWPTLTKSASSSSSDNRGDQVAPRDDGKSPRGQDWGPPGTLLRLYILHRHVAMYILDHMICYATWLVHDLYMMITGASVQLCNGREANHEDKVRYIDSAHVWIMRWTCARLCTMCDRWGQHKASMR